MAKYKTTIEIDGEIIFEIKFDDEAPSEYQRTWTSRTLSDKYKFTQALLEINKIGFEIAQRKIKIDEDRILNSKGPIVLG